MLKPLLERWALLNAIGYPYISVGRDDGPLLSEYGGCITIFIVNIDCSKCSARYDTLLKHQVQGI